MENDPCETCLRWPECNGVDADTCPLRKQTDKRREPSDEDTAEALPE